jgi:hypothetical protein
MLRRILVSLVVLWFGPIAALAQNTSGASSSSRETKTVTVTGCLTKGPQPNTYVLTKVPDPLVDAVVARTSGVIPTVSYALSGGRDLTVHVGHKLEVTGKTSTKPLDAVKVHEVEVRKEEPARGRPTAIEVHENAAIAVRPLTVESVRAVVGECK